MQDITFREEGFLDSLKSGPDRPIHLILIATKPDIIKQVPLYKELRKRGHTVVLGHTGQHYDENLSGGMLKEFGVEPDFNLNVRGAMHEVVSQIIGRLGWILGDLRAAGKTVIPYVHGDTTTAMAAGNAGYCYQFASVHVEAGIRTLTPDYERFGIGQMRDIPAYHAFLKDRANWKRGSQEPYPEQFNTRCAEAGTGIHLAPVELDREFLLAEGYSADRIFVVGNSVVDATAEAMGRIKESTVFDRHPALLKGDFVRFCIHRRENCLSEHRFRAIVEAMIALVDMGRPVLLINMIQTKAALERFGLTQTLTALAKRCPHFVFTEVWPEYVDVIAAMSRAAVCATDSGSMQEEMNAMSVPCVTLRFGSDRSESIMNGGNLIAPPVDAGVIQEIVEYAWNNPAMRKAPCIYGKDVSPKCIDAVESILESGSVFRSDEERLGFARVGGTK